MSRDGDEAPCRRFASETVCVVCVAGRRDSRDRDRSLRQPLTLRARDARLGCVPVRRERNLRDRLHAVRGGIDETLSGALLRRTPVRFQAVTIIKPLHGNEWALLDNLSGFCRQGLSRPDPVPVRRSRRSRSRARGRGTLASHASGRADLDRGRFPPVWPGTARLSNILNMLPRAQHDILVFADSDVGVSAHYLRGHCRRIAEAGSGPRDLSLSRLAGPRFLAAPVRQGKQLSLPAERNRGHGRPACPPLLWTDHRAAAGDARQDRGFRAVHAPSGGRPCDWRGGAQAGRKGRDPADHRDSCLRGKQARRNSFRMSCAGARTIRTIDPAGHLGSLLTHPFALGLLAIALSGGAAWAWPVTLAALFTPARAEASTRSRAAARFRAILWLLPAWDLLCLRHFCGKLLFNARALARLPVQGWPRWLAVSVR